MDLGDAVRVGAALGLGQQGGALLVGGQHRLDQAVRPGRRFLRDPADALVARQRDRAAIGIQLAGDQAQQGGLTAAVAADQADPLALVDGHGGAVEQRPPGDAIDEIIDVEHGGGGDSRIMPMRNTASASCTTTARASASTR